MKDIEPGYGKSGIQDARVALTHRIAAAITAELETGVVGFEPRQVRVVVQRQVPIVTVQFDDKTVLQIDLWPHGPWGGWDPTWHYQTSLGGDLDKGWTDLLKIGNWSAASSDVLRVVREILLTVRLVTA